MNVGSANAAQLASDYANLASRLATLENGIPQKPEVVWSGGVGMAGARIALTRPLVPGDMVWLRHNDNNWTYSNPIIITQEMLSTGRLWSWNFGVSGATSVTLNTPSQLTTVNFTAGYGINQICASKAKI
ncbi:hypothetical protein [Pseudomonas sp. HMWF032]|uniref:hypothetical protein n=1 Tax=Pseudomonas sp. HMWF032 TaxID=2056866 RepID=UPI0011B27F85|nr:hypothetical protein [Pseudomonas sp. HMWF032]